jgi:hypothetical protein
MTDQTLDAVTRRTAAAVERIADLLDDRPAGPLAALHELVDAVAGLHASAEALLYAVLRSVLDGLLRR